MALALAGITLFAQDGKLRARPASALTEGLRAAIAAHRPALLARLRDGWGTQNPQNPQNCAEEKKGVAAWGAQNPQNPQNLDQEQGGGADHGPQNSQNSQNPQHNGDVVWVKERMKGLYGLIKEALEAGYLGPAQQVGADVVQAVEQVAGQGGDVARACRLLSRDGAGNDVAAAALVAAYGQLCAALHSRGVDPFRRRAAVALCLARALEPAGGPVVTSEGTRRRRMKAV